ncbi:MAG: hypothetical protein Q9173_003060 [Seirophora scorigena]
MTQSGVAVMQKKSLDAKSDWAERQANRTDDYAGERCFRKLTACSMTTSQTEMSRRGLRFVYRIVDLLVSSASTYIAFRFAHGRGQWNREQRKSLGLDSYASKKHRDKATNSPPLTRLSWFHLPPPLNNPHPHSHSELGLIPFSRQIPPPERSQLSGPPVTRHLKSALYSTSIPSFEIGSSSSQSTPQAGQNFLEPSGITMSPPHHGPPRLEGNYSLCSMHPANFTRGLMGVNLQMDEMTTWALWLSIVAMCLIVIIARLLQGGVSQLRHLFNLRTDPVQQAYWGRNGSVIWPWLKKNLVYAPLRKKRHNRNVQMGRLNMGTIPSRFHTLLLALYILSNVAYCCLLNFRSCNPSALLAELRGRSGHLAFVNMMPLMVFAGRNNAFIPLLRVSFDTFNILHRWIGRLVVVEAIVHTGAWMAVKHIADTVEGKPNGMMEALHGTPFLSWGTVSLVSMIFVMVQASSAIRHLAYEAFLHLHQLLAFTAFLGAAIHGYQGQLPLTNYVYITIAFWFLERFIRMSKIIYRNFGLRSSTRVTVEALPEACRVTFELKRPWELQPGCHVYAHFPTLTWSVSSHPFSIAWYDTRPTPYRSLENEKLPSSSKDLDSPLPSRTTTSITLIMSKKEGMTAKLHARARASPSGIINIRGFIEGPYGGQESLHSYGTVLLFAGGVGITHQLSHVRDLLQTYNDATSAVRKVVLIWTVRSQDAFDWVHPWMTEIFQMPHRRQVLKVLLFVTKPRHAGDIVSRSNQVQMFGGRCKPGKIVEEEFEKRAGAMAVTVCGPGAFADEVRAATRERVQEGVVDFMEESFSW